MKQLTPMRRTPLRRGSRLRSVSRKTQEVRGPALRALRAHVRARAKGRCEFVAGKRGRHFGPLDCHHVVKRSHGGKDVATNLVALCRFHHKMTDSSFSKGRLVIVHLGFETFRFEVVTVRDKWAHRA